MFNVGIVASFKGESPELIFNGDFALGSAGWQVSTGWQISTGGAPPRMAHTNYGPAENLTAIGSPMMLAGVTYRLRMLSVQSTANLLVRSSTSAPNLAIITAGFLADVDVLITPTTDGYLRFRCPNGLAFITNISLKQA